MTLDFENLDDFFSVDEFAKIVTIDPYGYPRTINAIFDGPYKAVDGHGAADISSSKPVLTCKTSDLSDVRQNTKLKIDATDYKVHKLEPDGTGITRLELHKL